MNFSVLVGKTIKRVEGGEEGDEHIAFHCDDGASYAGTHQQDCCESVKIFDTVGNVEDIVGSPVILAEEENDADQPADITYQPYDSYTWTIYTIETAKGRYVVRWLGESNGYYGESPYFGITHN